MEIVVYGNKSIRQLKYAVTAVYDDRSILYRDNIDTSMRLTYVAIRTSSSPTRGISTSLT